MFAVVRTGGKQYRVHPGDKIVVEKLDGNAGDKVTLGEVLLAENAESSYVAYVSQQNLVPDDSDEPVDHPAISTMFDGLEGGRYQLRGALRH